MHRTLHRSSIPFLVLGAALLAVPAARAASPEPRPASSQKPALLAADKEFALEAGRGGVAEVEIAKVVASRATRKEVRDFAQRLVDDHGKANEELGNIAQQKNITLPMALDPKHQRLLDEMKSLSGSTLDSTYLREMIKDHEADAHLFERGERAQDPELKAFAERTLPTIQQHLEMARRLAEATTSNGAAR